MSQQNYPDDEVEQDADASDLDPKGEHRPDNSGFVVSRTGEFERSGRQASWQRSSEETPADIEPVPKSAKRRHREYYEEFAITQSALRSFDDLVLEPDWEAIATIDGERDEDMTEALNEWGRNCAVRAGELGHDISHILSQCPSGRRTKPAVLIEKIGTKDDPEAIAGLQMLEPSTMSARLRKNQNIVVQPDDPVPRDHPKTEDGKAAAYVQYDRGITRFGDSDPDSVAFAEDDILKLTYEPPEGSAWGRTIWSALAEPIDALKQKFRDRNAAIRLAGHPHRIYSSDSWTQEEAQGFADAHGKGDQSAWDLPEERDRDGYASRVDYVSNEVSVEVVEGHVADIEDAVKDDLEQLFAILPISKAFVAYEEDINQFVVEPQWERDDRTIDKERRYLEEQFEPLYREVADWLADDYEGEVEFRIRQPESDNPLERADFDADAFSTMVTPFLDAGAPLSVAFNLAGIDREEFVDEHDRYEDPDEGDPNVQEAADALGIDSPDTESESESDNEPETDPE